MVIPKHELQCKYLQDEVAEQGKSYQDRIEEATDSMEDVEERQIVDHGDVELGSIGSEPKGMRDELLWNEEEAAVEMSMELSGGELMNLYRDMTAEGSAEAPVMTAVRSTEWWEMTGHTSLPTGERGIIPTNNLGLVVFGIGIAIGKKIGEWNENLRWNRNGIGI